MNIKTSIIIAAGMLLATACSTDRKGDDKPLPTGQYEYKDIGDKAIYGLACEGCNDSTLVLLPEDCSDPVKYDIIDASRNGRVLGKPKIGDWVTVTLDPKDKRVATSVVDLDDLKGIWCYIVLPKMRDYDKMSKRLQQRMERDMPDSIRQTYLIPREYGFWLKRQWMAQSVGYVQEKSALEDESPVVYQPLGFFTAWHMWNGKIIIVNAQPKWDKDNNVSLTDFASDTCDIDYLQDDSLVLSSEGVSRSYYRKKDINDVNKKAIKVAAELKQKALKQTTKD